jgi:SAM-dependent methyltransferase
VTAVSGRRAPRLAAGRARALGLPTRGTTAPNRLRRIDRWLVGTQAARLRAAPDPLVVDLGYGSSPVTTVELYERLRTVRPDVRVLGLELDPDRVAAAQPAARPPGLVFARGGFELAGRRPTVIRALNVLRQYPEPEVAAAWRAMRKRLAPGGLLIEGTCDEIGRRACWFALPALAAGRPARDGADAGGPADGWADGPTNGMTLTLSTHLPSLGCPSDLAERLPKALIARNVPGEPIHAFLAACDEAWDHAASYAPFGPRMRWSVAVANLRADGWPVHHTPRRWRLGEVTLAWPLDRA